MFNNYRKAGGDFPENRKAWLGFEVNEGESDVKKEIPKIRIMDLNLRKLQQFLIYQKHIAQTLMKLQLLIVQEIPPLMKKLNKLLIFWINRPVLVHLVLR